MSSRLVIKSPRRVAWGLFLAMFVALATGCTQSPTIGAGPTDTVNGPSATATSVMATPTGAPSIPMLVYFSKHPDSDSDVNAVFAVNRVSPTPAVGTFAIQQLIAGPTAAEAAMGYYTELTASLSGTSNCGGPDFHYTIDNATHTGTLKFCRTTSLAGDLTGFRIQAEITKSLTQFPNVTKVIILNSSGHCFNDLSGADVCLH